MNFLVMVNDLAGLGGQARQSNARLCSGKG
jgi:hypothetical protein